MKKEKKKINFREWFRQWDSGSFDLTQMTAGPLRREKIQKSFIEKDPESFPEGKKIGVLRESEFLGFGRFYRAVTCLLCLLIVGFLFCAALDLPEFGSENVPAENEVIERYVEKGMEETGAVNVVAGVILDYRAFDTLGESHVLYTALTTVLILLLSFGRGPEEMPLPQSTRGEELSERDNILRISAMVTVPIIILFGIYVILNGHLGPGGGFSGGALIGGGLIFYCIAFGFEQIEKYLNLRSFRVITVCALCFYSLSKCYSFFCGANHLESVIRPGTPGRIFSAGLILPLNIAVGIVVACTMYGFYSVFKRGKI